MIRDIIICSLIGLCATFLIGMFIRSVVDFYFQRKEIYVIRLVKIFGEAAPKAIEAFNKSKKEK